MAILASAFSMWVRLADQCFWTSGATVGACYEQGHMPWTNPLTKVTTSVYDARSQRIELRDSASGTTTTYDPAHNYQPEALYVPTTDSRTHELLTLHRYDNRHRLISIDHQLCTTKTAASSHSSRPRGQAAPAAAR